MATRPKHVAAMYQEEYIDCRVVHLLVLLKFEYIIIHGKNHVKMINAHHVRMIHHYKNTKEKLLRQQQYGSIKCSLSNISKPALLTQLMYVYYKIIFSAMF